MCHKCIDVAHTTPKYSLAIKLRFVKVSFETESQGKRLIFVAFFKTIWERTPSIAGI